MANFFLVSFAEGTIFVIALIIFDIRFS